VIVDIGLIALVLAFASAPTLSGGGLRRIDETARLVQRAMRRSPSHRC
jgi:hypothetical protein